MNTSQFQEKSGYLLRFLLEMKTTRFYCGFDDLVSSSSFASNLFEKGQFNVNLLPLYPSLSPASTSGINCYCFNSLNPLPLFLFLAVTCPSLMKLCDQSQTVQPPNAFRPMIMKFHVL